MNELAKRAYDKLTEAWRSHAEANELAEQVQRLRKLRDTLFNDAASLRVAVKILAQDGGAANDDDVEALRQAFMAFEEGRSPVLTADVPEPAAIEEEPAPVELAPIAVQAATADERPGDVRLLDAVDEAARALDGDFKSGDVRDQLARLYPAILNRVHKASITGALARLAEVGVLERVTPGGRGREAVFRRKHGADLSVLAPTRKQIDVSEL